MRKSYWNLKYNDLEIQPKPKLSTCKSSEFKSRLILAWTMGPSMSAFHSSLCLATILQFLKSNRFLAYQIQDAFSDQVLSVPRFCETLNFTSWSHPHAQFPGCPSYPCPARASLVVAILPSPFSWGIKQNWHLRPQTGNHIYEQNKL